MIEVGGREAGGEGEGQVESKGEKEEQGEKRQDGGRKNNDTVQIYTASLNEKIQWILG